METGYSQGFSGDQCFWYLAGTGMEISFPRFQEGFGDGLLAKLIRHAVRIQIDRRINPAESGSVDRSFSVFAGVRRSLITIWLYIIRGIACAVTIVRAFCAHPDLHMPIVKSG